MTIVYENKTHYIESNGNYHVVIGPEGRIMFTTDLDLAIEACQGAYRDDEE